LNETGVAAESRRSRDAGSWLSSKAGDALTRPV
jgi:hypothetical protein